MGVVDRDQFVTASGTGISSASAVFSSAVSSGSLLIAINAYFNTGALTLSTVTDNINNAGFVARMLSTMVSDTVAHLVMHDKVTISSGAAASTYRISVNYSGGVNASLYAVLYKGSTFTFGSTGSSNGTSTGPRGPIQTASSTPVLFVGAAMHNSTAVFGSTVDSGSPQATYITTVDPTNASQILNLVQSTGSSLSQQLGHSMTSSTRWLAGCLLYTGQTAAAGSATGSPWTFTMTGVQ